MIELLRAHGIDSVIIDHAGDRLDVTYRLTMPDHDLVWSLREFRADTPTHRALAAFEAYLRAFKEPATP